MSLGNMKSSSNHLWKHQLLTSLARCTLQDLEVSTKVWRPVSCDFSKKQPFQPVGMDGTLWYLRDIWVVSMCRHQQYDEELRSVSSDWQLVMHWFLKRFAVEEFLLLCLAFSVRVHCDFLQGKLRPSSPLSRPDNRTRAPPPAENKQINNMLIFRHHSYLRYLRHCFKMNPWELHRDAPGCQQRRYVFAGGLA